MRVLKIFPLIKVLFVIFFVTVSIMFFRFKKQKMKKTTVIICSLVLISAGIANMVLGWIPMPAEQITLTATGEKSENAITNEVILCGVIADGKKYAVNNAVEGKWFWQGNQYMWRNENDNRQPEGTTRKITINIPVGAGRALLFHGDTYCGTVEISFDNETNKYDLYSDEFQLFNIPIPDSDPIHDNLVKIGRLALFLLFILLLMAYPVFAVVYFSEERIWTWFKNNWNKIFYILLGVCSFAVMFYNGKKGAFWVDEVFTLGWVYSGYPGKTGIVFQNIKDLWFSLMPFGEEYLLILFELLTACSVYIMGMLGNLYKGKRFGVITAALCATSFPVLNQCGGEFRPYALLLFSVSAALYFFVRKQRERGRKASTFILYGLALTLAMDTHNFGLVFAGLIMIFDFILVIRKKISKAGLLEFIFPGLYAVYWIFIGIGTFIPMFNTYSWPAAPTLRGLIGCLKWFCSGSNILLFLLLSGLAITSVRLINHLLTKTFDIYEDYISVVLLFIPVIIFFLSFVYPIFFPNASVFVNRYFVVILPIFLFLMGIALDASAEIFCGCSVEIGKTGSIIYTVSCVLILCVVNWYALSPANNHENYKGTAEYLMSQGDIYNRSTICWMVGGNKYINDGFEYYLTQKGKRDAIIHKETLSAEDLAEYETIYCVYYHESFDPALLLENNYVEVDSNNGLALKKYIKADSLS